MDTSTHVAMGIGLAGLSQLSPAVHSDPVLANAVLIGTILGSNAPDFDFLIRIFKGKGAYVEHHRGLSHSIPAVFCWTLLLSLTVWLIFPESSITFISMWILLAVVVHILTDITNPYGTQAGRPFTSKWLSLGFIPLFDPFIMTLHVTGVLLWVFWGHAGIVFLVLYLVIAIYAVIRCYLSRRALKIVRQAFEDDGIITVVPTIHTQQWNFVYENEHVFITGTVCRNQLSIIHTFPKSAFSEIVQNVIVHAEDVQHFLKNSKHVHCLAIPRGSYTEVRFFDLRFRQGDHYPYMAAVAVDFENNILSSAAGWIHHLPKLHKKLISSSSSISRPIS
ncbi:metal-dependent hydrolase [Metabacillus lacus]|nr:metal-dependent hydrolase [Metabacillus lacus]